MENNYKTEPMIYVSTYSKYNSGRIGSGVWFNLESYEDKESFLVACKELHKDEADPELMFLDTVGIPGGFVSESSIEEELWDWLDFGDEEREIVGMYKEHVDSEGTLEQARDAFMGTFESEEDWAEDYLSETGLIKEVPESLQGYIDFGRYARDAGFNGMSFVQCGGKVWVFSR